MTSGYILIDASYYIFYRYYAAYAWYKRRKDVPPLVVEDILTNDVFVAMYDKKFEEEVLKLARKHKVPTHHVIFAKDCTRASIWRMQHDPTYKQNRDERLESFNGHIFKHTYQTLMPKLAAQYGMRMLEFPQAEADDVIAVLHQKIRSTQSRDVPIVIVTNDNDLLQLLDARTLIKNMAGLELKIRFTEEQLAVFTRYKVIMGDKSDNIQPIFQKCGAKTALKLATDAVAWQKKLTSLPDCAASYKRNDVLINFDNIPPHIRTGILAFEI